MENKRTDFATGAKRATATIALVALLSTSIVAISNTTAYAAVPAENIVGDLEYSKDRSQVKEREYIEIIDYFDGYDKKGNQTVTLETIKKAIELSDVLNGYYFDPLYYTNTTKEEVLDLDINKMYEKYQVSSNTDRFSINNLENKPAIDAYITLSCGTVCKEIESSIANRIYNVLLTEGQSISTYPTVYITDSQIYSLVKVNNKLQKIVLTGEDTYEIINLYNSLNYSYTTAINSIGGYSNKYESAFVYNGINIKDSSKNKESVWLSLPDDVKKQTLTQAIELCNNLKIAENYSISCENPLLTEDLTRTEEKQLKNMGYTSKEVNNAIKREAILNKMLPKSLVR